MDNWPTAEMVAAYEAEQRILKRNTEPDPIDDALQQANRELLSIIMAAQNTDKTNK